MATPRVLIGLGMLVWLASSGTVSAQDEDTPLQPGAGPYRGVVTDESTGQPLPSAVVIILWQRLDDQIRGLRRLSGARETFTNEQGEFVHDVTAVEGRLPPRTFAPRIVIFRPGYAPLPAQPQLFPPGVAAGRFAGVGAAVSLAPVTDYEDRAEAFNAFVAMLDAAQLLPATELPETSELIRFELGTLGARPVRPATPSGR
ncbi:MAG: hypothetical protein ACREKQ_01305 [Candidatus Rokuibacteriota bacterium]